MSSRKRISRDEQNTLNKGLEDLKRELGLARLSYERHAQHVVDYYAMFYKSYQLAQQTEHADLIRRPDQEDLDTKKNYLAKIDCIADEWNSRQGVLRLILPKEALTLHERAIGDLNRLKTWLQILIIVARKAVPLCTTLSSKLMRQRENLKLAFAIIFG